MARTIDYTAHLEAEDDITPAATKAAKALDKLESSGDVKVKVGADTTQASRDIQGLMTKIDRLGQGDAANLLIASNATQIAADIADLIIDLDKLDATDPQVEVKVDQIQQLQADLDQVQAKAKEINGTAVEIDTKPTVAGLDEVGKSADSSKSVLANMVGNATQDLGALGGVAGSAGVAIGQMGEYMVDAAHSGDSMKTVLANFAQVAGPIALITAAVSAVAGAMQAHEARAAAAAAATEEFGTAMAGAADDGVGLVDALRENESAMRKFDATSLLGTGTFSDFANVLNDAGKSIPLLGHLFQDLSVDVVAAMSATGMSMYDFADALQGSEAQRAKFVEDLGYFHDAGMITSDQFKGLTQSFTENAKAVDKARESQKLYNVDAKEANAMLDEQLKKSAPLEQYTGLWNQLTDDMSDGTIETKGAADAINFLSEKLGLTREEVVGLAQGELDQQLADAAEAAAKLADGMDNVNESFSGLAGVEERVSALGKAFGSFDAASDLDFSAMASNTVQSFDDIKAAMLDVKDIGSKPLVPTTVEDLRGLSDESAKVIDSISGMRDAIQTELGAALRDAGGNFDGLREKAAFFNTEVSGQFLETFRKMGLGPDEAQAKVQELLSSLGLLPKQVETVIKVTEAEEATRKIELFGSAIDNLPPEVQAKVAAAVDANDPVTAWNLINAGVQAQGGVPVPINTVPGTDTAGPMLLGLTATPWHATVDTAANVDPAAATLAAFSGTKRETDPVKVDTNTKPAEATTNAFTSKQRETPPVKVDANTAAAINTILYLKILASVLQPVVRVTAVLADYPSAGEIAARIGTVRVPVDAYVRTMPRINGAPP